MKTEYLTETVAKYLLVRVNNQHFAIPSLDVSEIRPASKATKLPFVPRYIAGLVNVGGYVIPLLDLSAYLDVAAAPRQVFVVIKTKLNHFALAVDVAIDEIVSTDQPVNLYESRPLRDVAKLESIPADILVNGDIEFSGSPAFILDMKQFEKIIPAYEEGKDSSGLMGKVIQQEEHHEELSLLVFQALDERFGFALEDVVEIIHANAIVPITGAPECVIGMSRIRDEALLVLSLPALLGRQSESATGKKLLIVIEREQSLYAIDIASFASIETFSKNKIQKSQNEKSLFSDVLIDEQRQVTVIIKNNELVPDALHQKLRHLAPRIIAREVEIIDTRPILHVTLNNLSYAFPLDDVRLVSPSRAISRVNDSTHNICGIIEIEGRIISVINPGKYLGVMDVVNANPQYVVIGNDQTEWAVPVTQINEIIEIPVTDIEQIESDDLKHLSGVAHYQGQLFPVVNLKQLYMDL